ncbi:hypothetical protein B0T21DRAFT_377674 [Apiosordaria backusii]|uniref:Uncharacterized protein n=1 Tax=Apiosordaria backusii TaxID=314023 RepID=A0AA39ZY88_9PEZI|nr:hypothetical protein B0T21DRAFT_377674 [Apiosordaria backusii]
MNMLRACAASYPDFFNEFRPRLNAVLLQRHRQGLLHGRSKTLNEAPLQPHRDFDLTTLAAAIPDESVIDLWATSQDGHVTVDAEATLFLHDIRPSHYRIYLLRKDRFGLLATRGEDCLPSSPQHPAINTIRESSPPSMTTEDVVDPGEAQVAHKENQCFEAQLSMDLALDQFGAFEDMFSPMGTMQLPDSTCLGWDDMHFSYAGLNDSTCELSSLLDTSSSTLNGFVQPCSSGSISDPSTPISGRLRPDSELTGTSPTSCESGTGSPISDLDCATLCLGTAPNRADEMANLEGAFHSRYHDTIISYIKTMSEEAHSSPSELHQPRIQCLKPTAGIQWASMWTHASTVPPGSAASLAEADVFYLTCDEAMQTAKTGEVLQKPMIIKETFLDSGMHTLDESVRLLENGLINHVRGPRNITHSHRPLITMLPRFRLLDYLAERLRLRASGTQNASNDEGTAKIIPEIRTDFNTLTFPGALSEPSFATMSGIWMRNLDGLKLCSFIQLPYQNMDFQWETLAKSGKQKFFVLEQDDVLIIPPASRIVYAIHSPTRGIMEGGMFWDSFSVVNLLESVEWIRRNGPGVASQFDQDIISQKQFLGLLEELSALVEIYPDTFQGDCTAENVMKGLDEIIAPLKG